MFRVLHSLALAAGLCLAVACGEKKVEPIVAGKVEHPHEHVAPHGGTPVELGAEEYHLEWVRDAAEGKLLAYVLDGEMENFIRIPAETIELTVKRAGQDELLVLKAVASAATGEKVGDTSLFSAQADWLKTTPSFDGILKQISIRGHTYERVSFSFPKGIDADGKNKQ
jgi:hypothetical protein